MRILVGLLALVVTIAFCGCRFAKNRDEAPADIRSQSQSESEHVPQEQESLRRSLSPGYSGSAYFGDSAGAEVANRQASFDDAQSAESITRASDRKIIKNADLSIEVDAPKDAQAKIASIAEAQGGFVVTSEFKQSGSGASKPSETVTIVVRVPSSQFGVAVAAIRGTGNRVILEKVSGQDVTEEYIDLEARIRTQKALESQFLEIMKQARKVEDALQVQRELAQVRTEIERLEGRRRFLDNKASLSTITVTLQTSAPLVTATTSGFGHDVRDAFGDGVDTAVGIVLGLIRIAIILVPITILIVLPLWFLLRRLLRRFSWPGRQAPLAVAPAEGTPAA